MLQKIADNIKLLEAENNGRYPYSNSLIITDEEWGIIDTCPGQSALALVPVEKISVVLNTHFHLDHTANNNLFNNARFYIHHLDAEVLSSPEVFKRHTGFDYYEQLGKYILETGNSLSPFGINDFIRLQDGDEILIGNTRVKTLHTPGHCAGHCSFYFPKEDILFSGDIDLTSFGPWYGNRISNIDQFIASIQKIMEINPSCLVTSHTGIVRERIKDKLLEYLQVIESRDEIITALLSEPKNLEQIVAGKPFFRRYPQPEKIYLHFERQMVKKHLDRLLTLGRILMPAEGIYQVRD